MRRRIWFLRMPHTAHHHVDLDGTVYRVSARTLHAIEQVGPEAGRDILLEKGYLVAAPSANVVEAFKTVATRRVTTGEGPLRGRQRRDREHRPPVGAGPTLSS